MHDYIDNTVYIKELIMKLDLNLIAKAHDSKVFFVIYAVFNNFIRFF